MYTIIDGSSAVTSDGDQKKIVTISVSTASDIPEPEENWGCGSMCIITSTHSVKMLNDEGAWE